MADVKDPGASALSADESPRCIELLLRFQAVEKGISSRAPSGATTSFLRERGLFSTRYSQKVVWSSVRLNLRAMPLAERARVPRVRQAPHRCIKARLQSPVHHGTSKCVNNAAVQLAWI
eukprot:15440792-Alexandrium_andersonii.AAC.1